MSEALEEQVQNILDSMDEQAHQEPETNTQPPPGGPEHFSPAPDEIQDIYLLIVREQEEAPDNSQVVDSAPVLPQKISFLPAYAVCCFYFLLIVSTLAFQIYALLNPPIATVTIIPKTQTVTLTETLQLGRILSPLTISQSQTVSTTGKGHQDARNATGFITFYNGQLTSVIVPAGTILTGNDGTQIATDQDADIPRELQTIPPTLGQATVTAHALEAGSKGNIPTGDINQACCAPSILAQNTTAFHGGQDERDFSTVSQQDIHKISTSLKTSLSQSVAGAFQEHLKPDEQVFILPCYPTVISDHQIGQEATTVNVTISQTCSAVAYNQNVLLKLATALLSSQAAKKLGSGYTLLGTIHFSITQATVSHTTPILLLSCHGTWVYTLDHTAQEHFKRLIAGKRKGQAVSILSHISGIQKVRIAGLDDNQRLPKNQDLIIFHTLIVESEFVVYHQKVPLL